MLDFIIIVGRYCLRNIRCSGDGKVECLKRDLLKYSLQATNRSRVVTEIQEES